MLITTVIYCYGLNRLHASSDAVFKLFMHVHKIVKSDYWLHHVCLSARNDCAPTEQIFSKFDIWVFFENLLRKFKFH